MTTGYKKQGIPQIIQTRQRWWKKTDALQLLKLPDEIRRLIFQQTLG